MRRIKGQVLYCTAYYCAMPGECASDARRRACYPRDVIATSCNRYCMRFSVGGLYMGYLRLGIACCNFFAVAITAGKRFYLGDVRQKIKEISSCMRVSKRF